MILRDETLKDLEEISAVTTAAFAGVEHSSQTEAAITDALRAAGVLTLSIVAEDRDRIIGHIAFSSVLIDGRDCGWYGLGPIAVRPDRQAGGIGSSLVREGLLRLKTFSARGCVLLGDPGYYARFGFAVCPELKLEGVPPQYFQALYLDGDMPSGTITYHSAFDAS